MQTFSDIPRYYTCAIPSCTQPAIRCRRCAVCKKHRCARHEARRYHYCPSDGEISDEDWNKRIADEVADILAKLNIPALLDLAQSLNDNKLCVFEPGQYSPPSASIMGGTNYHAWLIFEDGERWLLRTPRVGLDLVPPDVFEYIVTSEYATLKFLETTSIPAPRAFSFGLSSDPANKLGIDYLLIQALPGRPYKRGDATLGQSNHVLEQIADMMIKLSQLPFSAAGSLITSSEGNTKIGPVSSNRFIHLYPSGPHNSPTDYFADTARQYLDLIADGQLHERCPVEAYLFYSLLLSRSEELSPKAGAATDMDALHSRFFLKHVDDKDDHLLVDDDHNITGIIDWQSARIVPAIEAFGPSILTSDLDRLVSGKGGLTQDDRKLADALRSRGHEGLAQCVEVGDLVRTFMFGPDADSSPAQARAFLGNMLPRLGIHAKVDQWIQEQQELFKKTEKGRKVLSKIQELLDLQKE
ncbi:uncharacterized protein B0I36DRAFT_324091 [Microdochium trichocladiopsis]|uniref:Aminoglycoside phosphotransferase domain-containing protein n=1 Tax=Microdochium trichocladiopsis TaxID=1682393 RepID=A0A9P8YA90_9PEZI|nr:uncharacterized protein B0I36DRAFT_324091 [Microdochium trichocladiopsis]KAH7031530.1 hypothetical protein B0I36DRAFT_324091 [Microdochium trichocladiopsis]